MKVGSVDISAHVASQKLGPRFFSDLDTHTCSQGDADEDGRNKGSITPVSVELVYQGNKEDAKGVGDSVG